MRRRAAAEQAILNSRAATSAALTNLGGGENGAAAAQAQQIVPVVPSTIIDQIHLWQLEKDRMTSHSGYLMKDFGTQAEFADVCRYADETGVLSWKNEAKRMFFVSRYEGIAAYIKDKRDREA